MRIRTQQSAEVVEDQAKIVSGAAEQAVGRITTCTGEEVPIEAAIRRHVADHRLDSAAPSQLTADRWRHAATLAGDEDPSLVETVSAVTTIDVGSCDGNAGHVLDLQYCRLHRSPSFINNYKFFKGNYS
jgi:hypothetical protein